MSLIDTEHPARPDQPACPTQLVAPASDGQERVWLTCQTEGVGG